jgi:hypothetical protein
VNSFYSKLFKESVSLILAERGMMIAASTGGVSNLKTVEALTTQGAKAAMEKANSARAGFKSAGS